MTTTKIQSRNDWRIVRPPSGSSWASFLASRSARVRDAFLAKLPDEIVARLPWIWEFWARDNQLEPDLYYFVWFCMAGRGWGKTRTGAETVQKWAREGVEQIAIVAETPREAERTNIRGRAGICSIADPDFCPVWKPTKAELEWPGRDDWITRKGPKAFVYSGSAPGQLRGPQHEKAWVDELAKFKYHRATWSNLLFTMRDANDPRVVLTTTPTPIKLLKEILGRPSTILSHGSTYENVGNLTEIYYQEVVEPLEGTELAQQEIHAKLLEEAADALWKRREIEQYRIPAPDHIDGKKAALEAAGVVLEKIVVAVDPATTNKTTSDECGIVVFGTDTAGEGYVLGDYSKRASPAEWARRAVHAFEEWDADYIVYETNQGGDMVRDTLLGERSGLPLRDVHASRSKQARAEPISLKAEKGQIHHVGTYPELEDEQCTWIPKPGAESPNHLDAMVWGASRLMLRPSQLTAPRLPRLTRGERT